jgi:mono/diheme cytochrome c family protein
MLHGCKKSGIEFPHAKKPESVMPRGIALVLFLTIALGLGSSPAGEPFKPGKLSKEEIAKLDPGLTLRFVSNGLVIDARRVRLAALHVPQGSAPSVQIAPGKLEAELTGLLKLPLKGEYAFKLVGSGDAKLAINGKTTVALENGTAKASAPVELVKGYNLLTLNYTSPGEGQATIRVYWSGENFAWEPLPPDLLFSRKDDANLVSATSLREGRLLFATHGCAHCHKLPGKLTVEKCAMPEMRQQAPSLEGVGKRLAPDFLAKWIGDPQALRPEATMPKLFDGPDAAQKAADVAAYLGTLTTGTTFPDQEPGDADQGGKLFLTLGCITCHRLEAPGDKDDYHRLSLHYAAAKFQPGALAAFLRQPQQHYPWIRMPDFKLVTQEASALAAYLRAESKGKVDAPVAKGDAGRGAKLFQDAGCIQCHVTKDSDKLPSPVVGYPAIPVKGCLAEDPSGRGKAPAFSLTDVERRGLRTFLASDLKSVMQETPAEFSSRQMKLLQCNACHTRDGIQSRWYSVLIDEGGGVQPEYLPHLTWTGEKLHPEWTEKQVAGTQDHRVRPWIKARMPAFPARAALIASGLSYEHGYGLKEDPRPEPDAKLAAIGQKLLPQVGGFNCVQCHAVGDNKAVAPFEAEGINLRDAAIRLRYEFYARWMLEPTRVDPTTRMTKFTLDGKTTAITDVLGGNARQQFDAIWQYMQTLPAKK